MPIDMESLKILLEDKDKISYREVYIMVAGMICHCPGCLGLGCKGIYSKMSVRLMDEVMTELGFGKASSVRIKEKVMRGYRRKL